MKKLLLIGNPSVLGKNLENILKQNYHTDFISAVPKQISSILQISDKRSPFLASAV